MFYIGLFLDAPGIFGCLQSGPAGLIAGDSGCTMLHVAPLLAAEKLKI